MFLRQVTASLLLFTFVSLSGTLTAATVQAASGLISYQGRLTDSSGAAVPDSSYSIIFAIYADSTGGGTLWQESATVTTQGGLFLHQLGSVTPLSQSIFQDNDRLYLQVTVGEEIIIPRTRLASVPYAYTTAGLSIMDANDSLAIKTFADSHQFSIFGPSGLEEIRLRGGVAGDESVILPNSSINNNEILDEPGIAVDKNASLIPLSTGSMMDLVTVDITTPADGYIVLHGKCYLLFSGTTGPNTALVQIDEYEGGSSSFPYYTVAGLGGYVNTETSYFPVYVTRTYYKTAGTYTFRMEGRASHSLPAEAKSWDHILTAVFYPTSYEAVMQISPEPGDHPEAIPVIIDDPTHPARSGTYYKMDLRYYERQAKTSKKIQKAEDNQGDNK